MNDANDSTHVPTCSACHSNYQGMTALVGADDLVYLGKADNYHYQDVSPNEAYYDNTDGSLQFISDNITMYHFLYGEGWVLPQKEMLKQHYFHKRDYAEFARLQERVLCRYPQRRELTFAGRPFVPPKSHDRGRRSTRRPVR